MYACAHPDRRTVRRVFLLTAIFFFGAHLYRFCTLGFSHDSLLLDQSQDTAFQLSLGRFMQPLYWQIRGDIVVPFLIGLLACIFLALTIILVVSLLRIRSTLSIALVCMALSVNATVSIGNATYISWADVYMLALFLSTLSVYLFCRFRFGFLISPFLLCASLGLYQSYLQTAILLYLMVLVHKVLDKASVRSIFCTGIAMVAQLLAGLLLYAFVYPLILNTLGIAAAATYNGLANIGNYTAQSFLSLAKESYFYPFHILQSTLYPQTHLPDLAAILYALLLVITIASIILTARNHALTISFWAMLMLLTALMPLGANIIYVISKGMVHILMCYSFFFFFVFPISLGERLFAEHHPAFRAIRTTLTLTFLSLYLCNAAFANQLYLRRDLEMQSTLSLMSRIIDRMDHVDEYHPGETPVAFVGTLFDTPFFMNRPGFENLFSIKGDYNVYAISYETGFSWYFNQVLGYPIHIVSEQELAQTPIWEEIMDMPIFPEDDCCQMIDDILIVHLSRRNTASETQSPES